MGVQGSRSPTGAVFTSGVGHFQVATDGGIWVAAGDQREIRWVSRESLPDLLDLKTFQGIPILAAADALRRIEALK